jgi:hypothetical protein
MPLTNYPQGLTSFGAVLPGKDFYTDFGRKHIFVHGNLGDDGTSGESPEQALKTMAQAFTRIESGSVIHVAGNITEQLSSPAGIFDVVIVGAGTRPRHADAHTGQNGYKTTATWKPPSSPTAATALLKLRQQGWRIANILFDAPADAAAIDFMRDAAAGDDERDAGHSEVLGCRFVSGSAGIKIIGTEILHNLLFHGNIFEDLTTAISMAAGYGRRLRIEKNEFRKNTNHIVAALAESVIIDNVFTDHTTQSIDLNGGGGKNIVTKNYLSGTYSVAGGYRVSNANDEWAGNFNTLAGGITVADPA